MRHLLIFFALLLSVGLHGQQLKKFHEEPDRFIADLNDYFLSFSEDYGDSESLFLRFRDVFLQEWSEAQQPDLISSCNHMLRKRVKDHRSWVSLLAGSLALYDQEGEEMLSSWLVHLKKFSGSSPKRITSEYLYSCMLNLTDSLVSDMRNVGWKAEGGIREFRMEPEPLFVYSDIDLIGFFRTDSTLIEGTSGILYPLRNQFEIEGGTVYFTRSGFGQDTLYAELNRATIELGHEGFEADSVTLYSEIYLQEPTLGHFMEQLSANRADFPRFESYSNQIRQKDIVPNVDYVGGFHVLGDKLFGSASGSKDSKLFFKYDSVPLVRVSSDRFQFKGDVIRAEDARVAIYVKDDSISHPRLTVQYIVPRETLTLLRPDKGSGQTAFANSYHNMAMYLDIIQWNMKKHSISMGNLQSEGMSASVFESDQYFRGERMRALQGLSNVHPLAQLKRMTELADSLNFGLKTVQRVIPVTQIKAERFLLQMMVAGFVDYDLLSQRATVRPRTFEYLQNYSGRRDYDVIRFQSRTSKGENARLSLLDHKLEIKGIRQIAVSDSQKVAMFPYGRKIEMNEGFDFKFDGVIQAGRFTYWGHDFLFNYDQFRISMTDIDSMKFKVQSFTPDVMGRRPLRYVRTTLQDFNGELYIDKPNNKSSRRVYHDYPIFTSGKKNYIYYDRRDIYDRVYPRETFFVEVHQFTIDSLDNATAEGLSFDGTFVSAGIFPEMEQTLRVQRDYSLGFRIATPLEGLSAYGGAGQFTDSLSLDESGLVGGGSIRYLSSLSQGKAITFFPDSATGLTEVFDLTAEAGTAYHPPVRGIGSFLRWLPNEDRLEQSSREKPFEMYDDVDMLGTGTLALTPAALEGRGQIDFLNAQMHSKDFVFQNRRFDAEHADFRIRPYAGADWAFSSWQARSSVDFDQQAGRFEMLDSSYHFAFDVNQYDAYMDRADWDIQAKTFNVKNHEEGKLSPMVSVNKAQDSLHFDAASSKFSLLNSVLEVYGVEQIKVADASIKPDSGRLTIDTAANMRLLDKSVLLANRFTRHFNLYDCSLKIQSRNRYSGNGILEYVDQDETPWPLYFHTLGVNKDLESVGSADVKPEDEFYMSPFFGFQGKVEMLASAKYLTFNGKTNIQSSCSNISTTWFPFRSPIDPNNIVIDLPKFGEDKAAERLFNGIFIANDSTSAYSAFLSRASKRADIEIIRSDGQLLYDEDLFSYVIAREDRIDDEDHPGNYLILQNKDCYTEGQGSLSLGEKTGLLKIGTYGRARHDLKSDRIEIDALMGIQFPFDKGIIEDIADAVIAGDGRGTVDISRRAFRVAMNELMTADDIYDFDEEVELYGAPDEVPDALRNTFTFSDLKMEWDPATNSFLSVGDIGLGSILKEPINKKVRGGVQLIRKRRGDELNLYFKDGAGTLYFFGYKRNVLQFYSTDEELMAEFQKLDEKKRRFEEKKGFLNISQASKGKAMRFVNEF